MHRCIAAVQEQCSRCCAKQGYSGVTGGVPLKDPATTGETTMTSTRLNALFASTLATAFSFAFVLLTMPLSALSGGTLS